MRPMHSVFGLLVVLCSLQYTSGCIAVEKITTSDSDEIFDARGNGNIWNPPHKGCNILPCGGFLNWNPTIDGALSGEPFIFDGGSSNSTCDSNDDCPDNEVCVKSLGTCNVAMFLSLEVESVPPADDKDENDENTPMDGTITISLKYGDNPQFYQSPGFDMSNYTFDVLSDKERPYAIDVTEAIIPEFAFASLATIQINHTTTRPDTGEVVSFFQCIDINVTNAPPFNASEYATGGPNDEGMGVVAPTGAPMTVAPTPATATKGLHPFYYVLIVLVIFLICVCACCLVNRYNKNKSDEDAAKAQDANDVENQGFQPVLQEDVLPNDEVDNSENLESRESEPSKPSSLSGEDVAHLKYQDDEDSDGTTTPDPSGGTGSQGRHFHFKYTEGEDDK